MKLPFRQKWEMFAALLLLVTLMLHVGTATAACQAAQGQVSPVQSPTFDVAAIHLHKSMPSERSHIIESAGRLTTINESLKAIMQWAFDVPASRIIGGPAWIDSDRFDIEAKSESTLDTQIKFDTIAARKQKRAMMQTLLANRFHLVTHLETRELPIFALVVAKSGPSFLKTQAKGTTVNQSRGHLQVEGGENTMTILAESLAEILDRIVVDKTGIEGKYSLNLKWTPDGTVADSDQAPLSIYTALQEQLGLKLEPQKGPVEVLVIDRVEMPSEN